MEIASLGQRLRELSRRMTEKKSTRVFCVMLPEPLAVRETERLLAALKTMGSPASSVFVNRLVPDLTGAAANCARCATQAAWQAVQLKALARRKNAPFYLVEDHGDAVAGKKALQTFTRRLWQFA